VRSYKILPQVWLAMFTSRNFSKFVLAAATLIPFLLQSETLTIPRSIELAFDNSLSLKQAEAEVQMKLADCWQAGLWINPELSIEFDNIGTSSSRPHGWDDHEATVALSQIFELGGKRTARQNTAAAEACIAIWDREMLKQELKKNVTDAFIDVAALRDKIKVLEAARSNEEESLHCVTEKMNNGKASLIQLKQSKISLSTASIAHRKAIVELSNAERNLSSFLGTINVCVGEISFPIAETNAPNSICEYTNRLDNNPEVAKWRTAVSAARENYGLERANRIPDLEVTAGYCRDNHSRDSSLLLEMSIVLPIFDRNEANICRSSWETWMAAYKQEEIEKKLLTSVANVHEQLLNGYDIIGYLKSEAVPATQEALKVYEEGYQQGKFECLDVLLAKSKQYEVQLQLIDALTEYHHLKTQMEILSPTYGE